MHLGACNIRLDVDLQGCLVLKHKTADGDSIQPLKLFLTVELMEWLYRMNLLN